MNLAMKTTYQLEYESRAEALYQAACVLMRHQDDSDCWHNLQNAAAHFDAARQSLRLAELQHRETSQFGGAGQTNYIDNSRETAMNSPVWWCCSAEFGEHAADCPNKKGG